MNNSDYEMLLLYLVHLSQSERACIISSILSLLQGVIEFGITH